MELSTIIQVLICVVLYGGFVALIIEYIVTSIREGKSRPNPAGDLVDEPDQ